MCTLPAWVYSVKLLNSKNHSLGWPCCDFPSWSQTACCLLSSSFSTPSNNQIFITASELCERGCVPWRIWFSQRLPQYTQHLFFPAHTASASRKKCFRVSFNHLNWESLSTEYTHAFTQQSHFVPWTPISLPAMLPAAHRWLACLC